MVVVAGFTLLAGLYTLGTLQGVRALVIEPADLPHDAYTCDGFKQAQGVLYDSGQPGQALPADRRLRGQLQPLPDTMISELEYRGWTVHSDGAGNLDAYSYTTHEELTASMAASSADPTMTSISVDVYTGLTQLPADFPGLSPSPSPSA